MCKPLFISLFLRFNNIVSRFVTELIALSLFKVKSFLSLTKSMCFLTFRDLCYDSRKKVYSFSLCLVLDCKCAFLYNRIKETPLTQHFLLVSCLKQSHRLCSKKCICVHSVFALEILHKRLLRCFSIKIFIDVI